MKLDIKNVKIQCRISKMSSASGGEAPWPSPGLCPLDLGYGLRPWTSAGGSAPGPPLWPTTLVPDLYVALPFKQVVHPCPRHTYQVWSRSVQEERM